MLLVVAVCALGGIAAVGVGLFGPSDHAARVMTPARGTGITGAGVGGAADNFGGGDPVVAAVGDIACGPSDRRFNGGAGKFSGCQEAATARLLAGRRIDGLVLLGDEQYENGTFSDFQASFATTWGLLKAPVHPAPGNHEYNTSGAVGYFRYFGSAAGDPTRGYYSYNVGSWHLIALNSNCKAIGGCNESSAEVQWLRSDLSQNHARCTLAYWHHPRFSSGVHGDEPFLDPFWKELYRAGADVVLVGHDHDYERFAPQSPAGHLDRTRGIQEFVVGTGGRDHDRIQRVDRNSITRNDNTFGVLELSLHASSYDWRFVPTTTNSYSDSGTAQCH